MYLFVTHLREPNCGDKSFPVSYVEDALKACVQKKGAAISVDIPTPSKAYETLKTVEIGTPISKTAVDSSAASESVT
jgi:hypothetical protein